MAARRTLYSFVSLMLGAAAVDGPVLAQAQATAQGMTAIEKFREQDIAATLARDPAALTDLWTDDAVRLVQGRPPEVGRAAIRASNERWSARTGARVLSYVPETKDVTTLDGWIVGWRQISGSFIASSGRQPIQSRGTGLIVYKKMPDGSWTCFRAAGIAG
jgi:ketosteroid isomerase-like protein